MWGTKPSHDGIHCVSVATLVFSRIRMKGLIQRFGSALWSILYGVRNISREIFLPVQLRSWAFCTSSSPCLFGGHPFSGGITVHETECWQHGNVWHYKAIKKKKIVLWRPPHVKWSSLVTHWGFCRLRFLIALLCSLFILQLKFRVALMLLCISQYWFFFSCLHLIFFPFFFFFFFSFLDQPSHPRCEERIDEEIAFS